MTKEKKPTFSFTKISHALSEMWTTKQELDCKNEQILIKAFRPRGVEGVRGDREQHLVCVIGCGINSGKQ